MTTRLPDPDPTTLTSTTIDRSVSHLEEKIGARLDGMEKAVTLFHADLTRVPTAVDRQIMGLRELLETRFSGMDKDIVGIHSYMDKRRDDIREQINHLRDLVVSEVSKLSAVTDEKFQGVNGQFDERDTRTDQRAGDTKLAVDAAFAAAKEATAKIEAGFTKQIDAMIAIIDTKTANLAGGLGDLKDRMTALESRGVGSKDGIGSIGSIVMGAFSILAAIAVVASVIIVLAHR